jgi:hypothetical protein
MDAGREIQDLPDKAMDREIDTNPLTRSGSGPVQLGIYEFQVAEPLRHEVKRHD